MKDISVNELYTQTKLKFHLQESKASKCKLNAMDFLKVYIRQHRCLEIDACMKFFTPKTYSEFKKYMEGEQRLRQPISYSSPMELRSILNKSEKNLDIKKAMMFLEKKVDRFNQNTIIFHRADKSISMNLQIPKDKISEFKYKLCNFKWNPKILEVVTTDKDVQQPKGHKYISLIRLKNKDPTKDLSKHRSSNLKEKPSNKGHRMSKFNFQTENQKLQKQLINSCTDLQTLENDELIQTKNLIFTPELKSNLKDKLLNNEKNSDDDENMSIDHLHPDKTEIHSMENNAPSLEQDSKNIDPDSPHVFDIKKQYFINSMHMFHNTDTKSERELILFIPLKNQKLVNKTFVLERSVLLKKYFEDNPQIKSITENDSITKSKRSINLSNRLEIGSNSVYNKNMSINRNNDVSFDQNNFLQVNPFLSKNNITRSSKHINSNKFFNLKNEEKKIQLK